MRDAYLIACGIPAEGGRDGRTMSESLPKPLASINALRAHLKLLERGVSDARNRRTGPPPVPQPVLVPIRREATRPAQQSMQVPQRATDSGKPKAKPKGAADFAEFFQDIQKRAAG